MSFRTHHRKLLLKLESTEGTRETPTGTADYIECIEPTFTITNRTFERNITRKSITPAPIVTPGSGRGVGNPSATVEFSFQIELAGTGSISTAPRWSRILQCCGFTQYDTKVVTLSNSLSGKANGPQVLCHNENISSGASDTAYTSGNKVGRVVGDVFQNDRVIYYVKDSASTNAASGDEVFGQEHDVTATTNAVEADGGYAWAPSSGDELGGANNSSATIRLYLSNTDDYIQATGCRGNVEFAFASGDRVLMNVTMMGVLDAYNSGTSSSTDLIISNEGLAIPPGFVNVSLSLGESTYGITDADNSSDAIFNAMTLSTGNEMTVRESVSNSTGYDNTIITSRASSMTFNPDAVSDLASGNPQLDFWNRFLAGETMRGNFQVGSTSGNKFRFAFPAAQFTGIADGNRDEISILDSTCTLTGGDYGSSIQETTGADSTAISDRLGKDNELVIYLI